LEYHTDGMIYIDKTKPYRMLKTNLLICKNKKFTIITIKSYTYENNYKTLGKGRMVGIK
jgi:hypothetical protein